MTETTPNNLPLKKTHPRATEQLDELVLRVEEQLDEPWDKGIGRPKSLTFREAIIITCGYMRQNIIQEVWAEIFDTSQPVISAIITKFTPLIEASTEEDRPTVDEAKEAAAREQTVLLDGFLAPTWSWRDTPELWSGKHKTTGFNGQAIANLRGDLLFVWASSTVPAAAIAIRPGRHRAAARQQATPAAPRTAGKGSASTPYRGH